MTRTKIDWADYVWNPVWGCKANCPYCYARKLAKRWGKSFEPHWIESNFRSPMPQKPSRIFVNSMSELLYWEEWWWLLVRDRIYENPEHQFLFLTKVPAVYSYLRPMPPNCWLGITVTNQDEVNCLLPFAEWSTNIRFVSIEPLLGQIVPTSLLYDKGLKWVILGAETGNRTGKIVPPPEWIEPFINLSIPLFMKHNLPWKGLWRKEFPS